MGEVFLAEDTRLDRSVAIKLLPAKSLGDEHARRRLLREAKVAATLDHQNICPIYEVDVEGDTTFIVMQYVEGESLSSKIDSGQIDLGEAIDIAAQIAEALAEAHSRNVVHRDIKPGNVMVTPRGQVKVLDFGLAKLLPQPSEDSRAETLSLLTDIGTIVGTVRYMSPEQAKGETVDARSDIFSLGALLYESVTGTPAFHGANKVEICGQVIHVDPPPPSQLNPNVPRELDGIVLKALAKRTVDRYQTADELLADLSRVREALNDPSYARTRPMTLTGHAPRTGALDTLSGVLRKKTNVPVGLIIVGVVAAFGIWGGLRLLRAGPHQPSPEARPLYETGRAYLRVGAYFQASKALERAIELDKEFALAHARLAEAYAEIGNTDDANREFLLARSVAGDGGRLPDADVSYLRALEATLAREFPRALEYYDGIADKAADPDKPSAYLDLGRAYERNENIDNAIASYMKAIEIDKQSVAAYLRLGILYGRQNKLEDAKDAFDKAEKRYKALSNSEGLTEVFYQRGLLLNARGKHNEARMELQRALEQARTQTVENRYQEIKALLQLSNISYNDGDPDQGGRLATEAIEKARDSGKESLATDALIDLGNSFMFRGDYDQAEKYLLKALDSAQKDRSPRNEARARLQLGSLNVQRADPDKAIPYIEAAQAFYQPGYKRESSRALILLGRAHRQKGDYDAALKIFEEQLRLATELSDPSQVALSHQSIAGLLGDYLERYPEALTHVDASCEIYERSPKSSNLGYGLLARGTLLWQLGRGKEADVALKRALLIAGEGSYEELMAWVRLSDAQMALSWGRFAEAKAETQSVLTLAGAKFKDVTIEATFTLGLAQALSGSPKAGVSSCEAAVRAAEEQRLPRLLWRARLALAEAMLEARDAQAAVRLALDAQQEFQRSGQHVSEWRAWLIAARASRLADNQPVVRDYAARADRVLASLQQKWGAEAYNSYLTRPDTQTYRKQVINMLAVN